MLSFFSNAVFVCHCHNLLCFYQYISFCFGHITFLFYYLTTLWANHNVYKACHSLTYRSFWCSILYKLYVIIFICSCLFHFHCMHRNMVFELYLITILHIFANFDILIGLLHIFYLSHLLGQLVIVVYACLILKWGLFNLDFWSGRWFVLACHLCIFEVLLLFCFRTNFYLLI
jgi:hypothetical protein